MKKLMLIASVFMAGIVSANTIISSNGNEKNQVNKKEALTENKDKLTENKDKEFKFCAGWTTTCGVSAMTCATDKWTSDADWHHWGALLEENYCGDDAPFSNTSGLEP